MFLGNVMDLSKYNNIKYNISERDKFVVRSYTNFIHEIFDIIIGYDYHNNCSEPPFLNLDLKEYTQVLVCIYTWADKELDVLYKDFIKYKSKNVLLFTATSIYKVSLSDAEKMFNIFAGTSTKEAVIGPCCKCGLDDKWNSLGKDNKSYCYQHCNY
jgi:hypothetical protein